VNVLLGAALTEREFITNIIDGTIFAIMTLISLLSFNWLYAADIGLTETSKMF